MKASKEGKPRLVNQHNRSTSNVYTARQDSARESEPRKPKRACTPLPSRVAARSARKYPQTGYRTNASVSAQKNGASGPATATRTHRNNRPTAARKATTWMGSFQLSSVATAPSAAPAAATPPGPCFARW
jgi:hypothetical protein